MNCSHALVHNLMIARYCWPHASVKTSNCARAASGEDGRVHEFQVLGDLIRELPRRQAKAVAQPVQ